MHKYHLKITEYAEQDLEEIGDYIAFELKNSAAAIRLVRDLRKRMNSLTHMPEQHELDEDSTLASYEVRKYYYKNYKIYYTIYQPMDSVVVLRILHMRVDSRSKVYRVFGI